MAGGKLNDIEDVMYLGARPLDVGNHLSEPELAQQGPDVPASHDGVVLGLKRAKILKNIIFSCAQLYMSSCFFCGYVPFGPDTDSQVQVQTLKPDKTKLNINGFEMAKSAAQLLYSLVFV